MVSLLLEVCGEWDFSEKIICEFEPLLLLTDIYLKIKYFHLYIIHTFDIYIWMEIVSIGPGKVQRLPVIVTFLLSVVG